MTNAVSSISTSATQISVGAAAPDETVTTHGTSEVPHDDPTASVGVGLDEGPESVGDGEAVVGDEVGEGVGCVVVVSVGVGDGESVGVGESVGDGSAVVSAGKVTVHRSCAMSDAARVRIHGRRPLSLIAR
jgi:hypothetical protein